MTVARTRHRRTAGVLGVVLAAVIAVGLSPPALAAAAAPVDDTLAEQMRRDPDGTFAVLVHGADLRSADDAVRATGMTKRGEFRKIAVVIARATAPQVRAARTEPGVTYLEAGDKDRTFHSSDAPSGP